MEIVTCICRLGVIGGDVSDMFFIFVLAVSSCMHLHAECLKNWLLVSDVTVFIHVCFI